MYIFQEYLLYVAYWMGLLSGHQVEFEMVFLEMVFLLKTFGINCVFRERGG